MSLELHYPTAQNAVHILYGGLIIYAAFLLGRSVYRLYFHPLSKFPGPPLAAISIFPAVFQTFRGRLPRWAMEQHSRYGPIVRLRPHELSFIDENAWKEIYAHRQGHPQMTKVLRTKPVNGAPSLMSAGDADHARQRKLLSSAFSDNALRDQEPLLKSYVDQLYQCLIEEPDAATKGVDMVEWFTYITFDIVGDLSFGVPFGNLANKKPHPWVTTFKSGIKQGILYVAVRSIEFPFFESFIHPLVSPIMQRKRHEQAKYAEAAVTERLSKKTSRPDFMTNFLKENDIGAIPKAEIDSIFTIVALAGCESPATALSGALWYLLQNPRCYKLLQEEIRTVPSDADLTIANLSRLPYLRAVLEESMRVYPAVPAAMDRVVPPEGRNICGHDIPGGTWVGIPQLAANHLEENFAEPDSFVPERWMDDRDSKFDRDNRNVAQPFSAGPRNCIGQNLARAEMKLIMGKLFWHFDMELVDKESDWTQQSIYGLWDKDPLMIRMIPRKVQ